MKEHLVKYGALILLVVQNAAVALVTSQSRATAGPKYMSTTAVVNIEIIKFVICHIVVLFNERFSIKEFCTVLKKNLDWKEIALISVPAFLYTIQNNLIFIALGYLDPTTYQICYQGKILTTAIFSVIMLKKVLSLTQWFSLAMLSVGVALTQLSKSQELNEKKDHTSSELFTGFATVLLAITLSGFSGVYFEKILKKSNSNLWLRNIQLGMTSIFLSVGAVYLSGDILTIREKGFYFGYTPVVWASVLLHAVGGLLVAVVVKYADNILKGFATSFAVVFTFITSMYFYDFYPNQNFYLGAVLVNSSLYLYSSFPATQPSDEADCFSTQLKKSTSVDSAMWAALDKGVKVV